MPAIKGPASLVALKTKTTSRDDKNLGGGDLSKTLIPICQKTGGGVLGWLMSLLSISGPVKGGRANRLGCSGGKRAVKTVVGWGYVEGKPT